MKVLIGTTNPSKVKRFSALLAGGDIEFITLADIGVTAEPEERGSTPEENAVIKARFYGQFCDRVICNDSGLYFEDIPLTDPRQPGLTVRTPGGGRRLDDEEMIAHYAALVRSLGGRVTACWLDGVAVYNQGRISSFMDGSAAARWSAFWMVDAPSDKRHPGWPLDSISVRRDSGAYFVDDAGDRPSSERENVMRGEYRARLVAFLRGALEA